MPVGQRMGGPVDGERGCANRRRRSGHAVRPRVGGPVDRRKGRGSRCGLAGKRGGRETWPSSSTCCQHHVIGLFRCAQHAMQPGCRPSKLSMCFHVEMSDFSSSFSSDPPPHPWDPCLHATPKRLENLRKILVQVFGCWIGKGREGRTAVGWAGEEGVGSGGLAENIGLRTARFHGVHHYANAKNHTKNERSLIHMRMKPCP